MKIPKPSGGGIKPPAFASDVYKDMRDRRLIIPAIALLIAILAVPVLLASDPDPVVPAPPAAVDPDAAALEPGVLAVQEVGVRDFRERLSALARKNPFGDRFVPPEPKEDTEGDLAPPDDAGAPSGGTTDVTSDTSSPGGVTTPPPGTTEPQESFVLVSRVNVEVGIVGRKQVDSIENVKPGDVLPGKKAPTALYLGNTEDSDFAEFLISRDVDQVRGDGQCEPGGNNCEYLRLADSEKALLRYTKDGKRYSLRVTNISFARIPADEFNAQDD